MKCFVLAELGPPGFAHALNVAKYVEKNFGLLCRPQNEGPVTLG